MCFVVSEGLHIKIMCEEGTLPLAAKLLAAAKEQSSWVMVYNIASVE